MTLREHIEFAARQAREIFNQQGSLAPMVHAIDQKGEHMIMLLPPVDKDLVAMALREVVRKQNIQQLVYIAEAWVLKGDKDMKIPSSVANHPKRVEALVFQAETATDHLCAEIPIIRTGDKVELGPTDIWKPSFTHGRFANMFGEPTRH